MDIKRSGTRQIIEGPPEIFTGTVKIELLFQATDPARVGAGLVSFEPGARSAWHTHPLGQGLIVVSGVGWTQCWGEAKVEIRAGDVITCPPGKKHWHGASATSAMSHIAVQEMLNGKAVEWLEKVSDEQYLSKVP